jgi:hypothetical protein
MDITSSNLNDQQYMNNKDLITQYVGTGIGIPRYQFNKLSNNNKTSYLKKMEISIKHDARNIKYYYAELPEEVQLAAVNQNANALLHIDNPSPAVQLAAVKQDGYAIRYIYNPSPEAQMAVVKQDGHLIRYIDNPTPEVQLAAVNQNANAIRHIDNPSPELQLVAVNKGDYAIRHIENPSPEALALHKKLYGVHKKLYEG